MPSPLAAPSPLFRAHLRELEAVTRVGPIVDLACGRGRHALLAAGKGWPVIALDRRADFLAELTGRAARTARLLCVRADLEASGELPLAPESCGAILVFRFLFRPLAPAIVRALAPGGLLLYETFTVGQLALEGGPRRPEFLLEPGELATLFPELEVQHYEEVLVGAPPSSACARLAARKPAGSAAGSA